MELHKNRKGNHLRGPGGFVADKEGQGSLALYFDCDDDGLKTIFSKKRLVEVELTKKERVKL